MRFLKELFQTYFQWVDNEIECCIFHDWIQDINTAARIIAFSFHVTSPEKTTTIHLLSPLPRATHVSSIHRDCLGTWNIWLAYNQFWLSLHAPRLSLAGCGNDNRFTLCNPQGRRPPSQRSLVWAFCTFQLRHFQVHHFPSRLKGPSYQILKHPAWSVSTSPGLCRVSSFR